MSVPPGSRMTTFSCCFMAAIVRNGAATANAVASAANAIQKRAAMRLFVMEVTADIFMSVNQELREARGELGGKG